MRTSAGSTLRAAETGHRHPPLAPGRAHHPELYGGGGAQRAFGGYLPADLGQNQAYGLDSLIGAGDDGTGETIGMVEFSNYPRSDVNHFRTCFPGITGTYPTDVAVGGRTRHERPGRGRARPRGGDGGRARRPGAGLRRAERPELRPGRVRPMRQDGVRSSATAGAHASR